ncbi:TPA: helical hairpin domain-containing protein, partial [Streptococcus pyogenes]
RSIRKSTETVHAFQEERDKEEVSTEESKEVFKKYKGQRDAIHEFEVELVEHQIERLIAEDIYIKVSFSVKQSGLIFIPNYQLDIRKEENHKKYKVYIRETAQFFIYNKEASELNRYMRGHELICQLTNDSKSIPKRRRQTIDTLKKKIEEISLLIELDTENKPYQDIKDDIVKDMAQLDLTITELQDHIAHLNKVAEVLLNLNNNDIENRRLARYDYAKMNLTAAIKIEEVEKEIETSQNELNISIDEYEYLVRRLEKFGEILSDSKIIDTSRNEIQWE